MNNVELFIEYQNIVGIWYLHFQKLLNSLMQLLNDLTDYNIELCNCDQLHINLLFYCKFMSYCLTIYWIILVDFKLWIFNFYDLFKLKYAFLYLKS